MNYRTFGRLGWKVSEVSFGAWALGGDMWGPQDDAESVKALHRAVDHGVNFIDTAQGYGKGHSEEIIGKVLKERAEEIYVATKVPARPGSPWPLPLEARVEEFFPKQYVITECEKSLKRLGRESIDIYQFHTWTAAFNGQEEWFEAMEELRRQGKIRAVGVSVPDTAPDSVIGALTLGRIDSVQVIYNIFEQYPRWNLFPVARHLGTGIIVRVPFDEGALTGKYTEQTKFPDGDVRKHYFRGRNLSAVVRRVAEIQRFKDRLHPGMPLAEYALRFCLSHPAVHTVIPGIRNVQQADANTAASDGELLADHELAELTQFSWRKDFWHEEVNDTR
jgi:aryl-alcohol dehydrogenase-like predicted oxidoreductase